jgi:lysophospholipase L1-like esterase
VALPFAGCGGGGNGGGDQGGDQGAVATVGGNGAHRLIAAIGDSITAGYPGYAPDPAAFEQAGVRRNPRSQWEYWAQRKHPELAFRNCGVRGQRTDEIARRLDSCTRGADGVVIEGGINDLRAGIQGPVVLDHLQEMVRRAKRLELDVAVTDLLPYGPLPQADPAIDSLNREIAAMAKREGVTFLDFHRVLEDPAHPGEMRPRWNADGIHPSVAGYRRLGELAFKPPGQ